jgi:nucleoid-associated protein YgaU
MTRTGRVLQAAARGLCGVLLLVGLPAGLVAAAGWPLPNHPPTGSEILVWVRHPVSVRVLIDAAACGLWLMWAVFVAAVATQTYAAVRRLPSPAGRLPTRVQALTGLMVGAVGFAPSGPAMAATSAMVVTAPADTAPHMGHRFAPAAQAPLLPAGAGLVIVNGCPHVYAVRPGDSLWHIAQDCLGGGSRWPEIWQLNKGRFWPAVSGDTRLHDPDLIFPGWTLRLPLGAHAPTHTPRATPAHPTPGGSATSGVSPATSSPAPGTAETSPAPSSRTADSDGVATAPASHTPPAGDNGEPAPATIPPAQPGAGADRTGLRLPSGSWIPWSLAGALMAALAVVGLQRRRRYRPRRLDGSAADDRAEPGPAAAVLRHVQTWWRHRPVTETVDMGPTVHAAPPTLAEAPPQPEPAIQEWEPLTPGGLGLVGPGALAAARGALVTALAAGAPTDPHARTQVVIPLDAIVTLLGADAVRLGTWPRLQVTANLDDALALLEQRLLLAARLLDEHHADDVATLRPANPAPAPVPPMLLIAATPPVGVRARTRMILGLGVGAHVSAVLLGDWEHGATVRVDPDGTCHHDERSSPAAVPERMAVLDADDAYQLLATLREAHTGEPNPTPRPDLADRANDHPDDEQVHDDEKTATAPAEADDTTADEKDHDGAR